jgi:hypothetical protein
MLENRKDPDPSFYETFEEQLLAVVKLQRKTKIYKTR